MLVADEVQSGFGRTGRMFAVDHWGVEPDIMTTAKALGNGMPIAAIIARHSVMRAWHEGEHGTTYGGNAVACAAAVAVIETLIRDHIPERAELRPSRDGTRPRLAGGNPGARRCARPRADDRPRVHAGRGPRHDLVDRIASNALARGLLVLSCGIDGNVVRLIPPLTIPEAELDAGPRHLRSRHARGGQRDDAPSLRPSKPAT